jgi:hypothetical protein
LKLALQQFVAPFFDRRSIFQLTHCPKFSS